MDDVMLLHGFAGTGRMWDPVVAALGDTRYSAPDLHSGMAPQLVAPTTLVGYSMGGRLALPLALAAPEHVARLVLIAATAGLEDERARQARRMADAAQAQRIADGTIEQFAEAWMATPIFAGTSDAARAIWREDLLRGDPQALARDLVRWGQGTLPPVWDRLPELTMPADVVVGERDAKYREIGERLVRELPDARLHVVPGADHGVPREAPEAVAAIIAGVDPAA